MSRDLALLQTEGQIHTCLSSRWPQVYKCGQFIELPWRLIKAATNLLLQTS
jgi:hypothetical protein